MRTGKTTKATPPSAPFRAAGHLRSDAEIGLYIEEMFADGDTRAVLIALRTVADALGGTTALAAKTGLRREILDRTLSDKGSLRLETIVAILAAFELRLSVRPAGKTKRVGTLAEIFANSPLRESELSVKRLKHRLGTREH